MLDNVALGQYYSTDSVIHRLDPRFKIVLTLIYLSMIFFVSKLAGFAVIGALTVTIIALSGVPLRKVLGTIRPLAFVFILTFIINLLYVKTGDTLLHWWLLTITDDGVAKAVFMTVRVFFLLTGTSLLTLTTSPIDLTDGMEYLLEPLRRIGLPAHEIAMMMSIALRFIPMFIDETRTIMNAQTARGADFETGDAIRRTRAILPILVPLFVSSLRHAEELAQAMESRCYHGGEGRTRMKVLKSHRGDRVATAILLATAIVLIILF